MRFLSSCFYQGNSHNLSRDTKRGFSFPQIVYDYRVATRNEDKPDLCDVKLTRAKLNEQPMAMIDVLKWEAAPRVVAYHYPDCELNYNSQLVVTESQEAVLVKEGLFYGPIGPGRHTLETKNFPFLSKMVSALTMNRKTPYTAEVWFLQKSVPLDLKWGWAHRSSWPCHCGTPQYRPQRTQLRFRDHFPYEP